MPSTFTTSDGVAIAYDDEGIGRPVVLVHGFAGRGSHWLFQRRALTEAGYRVISFDQRLHGDSGSPTYGRRMSRLGQDLGELLSHLEVQDVVLVGHSMGVSVSLAYFGLGESARVTSFVAIEQSPKIINDANWNWGIRGIDWFNAWDAANFRVSWADPGREPPQSTEVAQLWANTSPSWEEFPHDLARPLLIDHFVADWRDVLPRISVPVLVVTGGRETFYDTDGMRWFAEQIPQGDLVVFKESGHFPHMTEAEAFNQSLLAFIA